MHDFARLEQTCINLQTLKEDLTKIYKNLQKLGYKILYNFENIWISKNFDQG